MVHNKNAGMTLAVQKLCFHPNEVPGKLQEFRSGSTQSSFIAKETCERDGFLSISQHHQKHLFLSHCRKAAEKEQACKAAVKYK